MSNLKEPEHLLCVRWGRSGSGAASGPPFSTAKQLSPAGLAATLAWLASADGNTAGALLIRPGVAAAVLSLLQPQHLQALQARIF